MLQFQPMRALKFITGHVIYDPAYIYKFQLKTTLVESNDNEAMPEVPPQFATETTFMPEGPPVNTETTIPLNRELQFVDGKKFENYVSICM